MDVTVARIGAARGLRGEVRLDVRTDSPRTRLSPGTVLHTDPPEAGPLTVRSLREERGGCFVAFAEAPDRSAAEGLRGVALLAEADDGEEDAWYPHELAGLAAFLPDGTPLGRIEGLEHAPAHDLLVLREVTGQRTLIPFVHAIVPVVDVEGGRVVLTPPGGLLASLGPADDDIETGEGGPGYEAAEDADRDDVGERAEVRVDVVTIFPEYLAPLGLSLVGKARQAGLLDIRVHDLRDWAQDRHRTVDDTPAGGGPGMVMRPDVWGAALDAVLADDGAPALLLVPTPAGERFSQGLAHDLAATLEGGTRLVVACGRYEGIDSRVAEHYASVPGVTVREVSIGDYVLGGGEVAALVVIEAVARLLPGVIGNAESLVEESHGLAGLLEGPVYTRPLAWRGLEVPAVLRSGDHARIDRWRRDRALDRTVERRPDMLARLDPAQLDRADRAVLAGDGLLATPDGLRPLTIRPARPDDAAALAEVAAATFPLACPPGTEPADIEAFVRDHLSPEAFAGHLADPTCAILLAEPGPAEPDPAGPDPVGPVLGYTLARLPAHPEDEPGDPDVAAVVPQRPVAELSKCYVRAEYHGSGLADALLAAAHADLAGRTVDGVPLAATWLGTNRGNRRGRRFYTRAGYRVVGSRRFRVGAVLHHDVVMVRPLGAADAARR